MTSSETHETDIIRQSYIDHLRSNPYNRRQLQNGVLCDDRDGYCAIGMACDLFGVDVDPFYQRTAYAAVADILDIPEMGLREGVTLHYIWMLNDSFGLSFGDIAYNLEKMWFDDHEGHDHG
jgi:hypothetical protein